VKKWVWEISREVGGMVNLELDFIAADANQALETTKNDQEKNKKKEKKKKNETV